MTKPTKSFFKKKKNQSQSLPVDDRINEDSDAKKFLKTKKKETRSLQTERGVSEDLEVAGEFTLPNQEKKWKKITRGLSRFLTWYFVRSKPPMPNTLLTRMFEYKCKIETASKDNVKEKSSSRGNSKNHQDSLNINKSTSLLERIEEDSSMGESFSTTISESSQGEMKSNRESKKTVDKNLLRKRKLDLLTGRARLPWIEENPVIICKKCACSNIQQEPTEIPIVVNITDKDRNLLPNQKVKLDSDEVTFAWNFEGSHSDSESEYMKPKEFTHHSDADLTEKLKMVRRTVELLNGRARFSWMDENRSFQEAKWKDNVKKFNNYLEELYL